MIFVQDLNACAVRNVSSSYGTGTLGINRKTLGSFNFHTQGNAFEVQDDVGDVFTYTGNRTELVQNVVDLNAGDGSTLQRAHQNATQRVAHCETKAAFQRFSNNSCLTHRVSALLYVKLGRLDEFCPIFVDHTSLHSCLASCPRAPDSRGFKMANWGRENHAAPDL